ncbi:MAG TPA: hypothetical protein VL335_01400 [Candidatus Paceibacterota bacterium]|jgi:hypothetical protein|nr:hypothetical protein [Candidatus Paceibacterota bacterium]
MNTENHLSNVAAPTLSANTDLFANKRTRSKLAHKSEGRIGWWRLPGLKALAYWWSEKQLCWNLVRPNPRKDKSERLMRGPRITPASSHIGWEAGAALHDARDLETGSD